MDVINPVETGYLSRSVVRTTATSIKCKTFLEIRNLAQ